MQGTWGGTEWSPVQDSQFRAEAIGPQLKDISTAQKILAPVMLLFGYPSNIFFGAVLLLGSLAALAAPRRELRFAAALGLAGTIAWGLIRPTAGVSLLRYNAVSVVFLLAAAGAVLGAGMILGKSGPRIAVLLAGTSLVVSMIQLQRFFPVSQSLMNPQVRQRLHELNVPSWAAFDYANENLDPAHNKILVIGETRGLWLHIPYLAPSAFNGPQLDAIFGGNSGPDVWRQRLAQLGISHVLMSFPEFQRLHARYNYLNLNPSHMESFSHWLQNLQLAFEDGRGTAVYVLPN
jgi:hypothetical protein